MKADRPGWPEPGDQLPRWMPRPIVRLSRWLLGLRGWKVTGELPNNPKQIILGAPHTSNWDWAVGIVIVFALGVKLHWLGKHTLFRWPYRYFFKPLGGIPVDRDAPQGIIGQACETFAERTHFQLVIAPEGTRAKVKRFKTGFYRIAQQANVPIALAVMDLPNKTFGFIDCPELSGDMETDIARIEAAYAPFMRDHALPGKHKETDKS